MRRYLIEHLLIEASDEIIDGAVLDVDDGVVVWSGSSAQAPERPEVTVQRLSGTVIPGLVNAHCHTPMMLFRGAGEGLPTDRWLTEVIWPREARLQAGDIEIAMWFGAAEMLRNGITGTCEMYFHGEQMAQAANEVGLRCLITPPLIESAVFSNLGSIDDQLADIISLRDRWSGSDRIRVGLGPHAAYSLSESTLIRIAEVAAAEKMPVHIHVAEQPAEGDEITARTGLSVPSYLDRLGLLTTQTHAAHSVWLTSSDIDLFAERGVRVLHCPVSNGRHASGIAPISALRSAGATVSLGTDGPVSHDRIDLFEEMRTAVRYARIRQMDAMALSAREALAMATDGASVGNCDLGRLRAGCPADFVRLETTAPEFEPWFGSEALVDRLVWGVQPEHVRDVWVGGEQRVADRQVIGLDLEELGQRVRHRAQELATG
jgi:5-methylthioadenosine/S-adenosylhomocysteine deaminase